MSAASSSCTQDAASAAGILSIHDQLDASKLQLKKWNTSSSSGGRNDGPISFIFALYNKQKLQLRLPRLRLPFGVTMFRDNMYLDLSLKNNDMILSKLQELDVELVSLLAKQFPNFTVDDIINSFNSSVRVPMNPAFGPTLRIKLTKDREQDYTFSLYSSRKDAEGKYLPLDPTCDEEVQDILCKRSEISSIIELSGIWYHEEDAKFGTTWKLVQAKKFEGDNAANAEGNEQQRAFGKSAVSDRRYAFCDSDSDESDTENAAVAS